MLGLGLAWRRRGFITVGEVTRGDRNHKFSTIAAREGGDAAIGERVGARLGTCLPAAKPFCRVGASSLDPRFSSHEKSEPWPADDAMTASTP
jgi:hypothetical protein